MMNREDWKMVRVVVALIVIASGIIWLVARNTDAEPCLASGLDWSCRHNGYVTNMNCHPVGKVTVCTPITTPVTHCACVPRGK